MSEMQHAIGSGFGPAATARDVIQGIDLAGRTAIVTGGYSGLGLEVARTLRDAGAHVIVPARSPSVASIMLGFEAGITIEEMDLMDPASIDAFARRFAELGRPLDLLINNAGIMAAPLVRDKTGHESHFSTNHLGHFRLTKGLWPSLLAAGRARVVVLSSRAHFLAPVDFDDPGFSQTDYDPWIAYARSKTANALFALALDQRGASKGVRAYSIHPGAIFTNLARYLTPEQIAAFGTHDEHGNIRVEPEQGLKNVQQGAATTIWCATNPGLEAIGGVYCEDCDIAAISLGENIAQKGVRDWAVDPQAADALWTLSERLTGIAFDI
jgi:NAD(P)-dependent dehydrogenase (short-subunit alcohol dehydrogenase family)